MANLTSVSTNLSGNATTTDFDIHLNVTVDLDNKIISFNGEFNGITNPDAHGSFDGGDDFISIRCNKGRVGNGNVITEINTAIADLIAANIANA